jgi:hypothetical protein
MRRPETHSHHAAVCSLLLGAGDQQCAGCEMDPCGEGGGSMRDLTNGEHVGGMARAAGPIMIVPQSSPLARRYCRARRLPRRSRTCRRARSRPRCGEHFQAQLVQSVAACPVNRRLYQGRADPRPRRSRWNQHAQFAEAVAAGLDVEHHDDPGVGARHHRSARATREQRGASADVDRVARSRSRRVRRLPPPSAPPSPACAGLTRNLKPRTRSSLCTLNYAGTSIASGALLHLGSPALGRL